MDYFFHPYRVLVCVRFSIAQAIFFPYKYRMTSHSNSQSQATVYQIQIQGLYCSSWRTAARMQQNTVSGSFPTYGQFYIPFSYFPAGCELPPSLFRNSQGVELFDIPHPIGRFVALPRSLSLSQKQRWHHFGDPHIRERVRVLSMRTKKIGTLTPMCVLRNKNSY